MPIAIHTDASIEVTVTTSVFLPVEAPEIEALMVFLRELKLAVPGATGFRWTELAPLSYRFRVLRPSNNFTNVFTFASAGDLDPSMTFENNAPGYKMSEFQIQRPLRNAMVKLFVSHGLSDITANYL